MILLAGALDYAGLFPPASLGMEDAVRSYAAFRNGPHRALLGRFVVPVARLGELGAAVEASAPEMQIGWELSVIGGGDPREDSQRIADAEARHDAAGRSLSVRSIERKVETAAEIPDVVGGYHDGGGRTLYLEVSARPKGLREMLDAVRTAGACAKLRTGGTTVGGFPSAETVARFVVRCSAADVPFKATAGLHHAVRGEYPVDDRPGCPRATMHGFLNVFVGAALLDAQRIHGRELRVVLEDRTPDAFELAPDGGVRWRDRAADADEVRRSRERLLHSFGTCSFEEPIAELGALGALS